MQEYLDLNGYCGSKPTYSFHMLFLRSIIKINICL
jgi:hypothetical protein